MSIAADIADALVDAVAAASTTAGAGVVTRDTPDLLDGDSPPLVLVSCMEEDFEPLNFEEERGNYTAVITLVQQRAAKVKAGAVARTWRQSVRDLLSDHNTLLVPEVWGCRIVRRGMPFPREGLKADLRYTTVAVEYWTVEERGGGSSFNGIAFNGQYVAFNGQTITWSG